MRTRALVLIALVALLLFGACEDTRSPQIQGADWFPPSQRRTALCIEWFESHDDPHAVSSTGDYGIFQLHRSTWERTWVQVTGKPWLPYVFDPNLNGMFAASQVFHGSWSPWSTARDCRH